MCIADFLDVAPKRRAHAVIREELQMKLLALREWDATHPVSPTVPAEVNPCTEAGAVGNYQSMENVA